jgi:Group XII secretory phospholipase A2 precursor (PLA2G12)
MTLQVYQVFLFVTLTISTAVVIVDAQFDGFGEKKFCKPYTCPKDHEPVPKWPLQLSSTGCSNMGGMQIFGGINDDDDPMRICCDLRNACIQTCGSIKTFCDDEFIQCGKDICIGIDNEETKSKCEKSASINDIMVKMDNCKRYDQAQYTHCECVSKDIVQKKRERVIRAFYKKYNPNQIDKVTTLVQKVDTPAKMVGLLLKLYKKYPSVVQKVKDPQQEMMEKMMKENRDKESSDTKTTKTQPSTTPSNDNDDVQESDAEDLGVDEL